MPDVIHVPILDDDVIKARIAQDQWFTKEKEPGPWTNGHNVDAIFIGVLGEIAFGRAIGLTPFLGYKNGGGSEDFIYRGYKIEVKSEECNDKKLCRNKLLIRCTNDYGGNVPLNSHIYVYATVWYKTKVKEVQLMGYAFREEIPLKKHKAIQGPHLNYAVPGNRLHPIKELTCL